MNGKQIFNLNDDDNDHFPASFRYFDLNCASHVIPYSSKSVQ